MGSLNDIIGRTVYLDANIIIYASEELLPFAEKLRPVLFRVDRGELEAVTSLLTLAEVLVKPLREGDSALVARYQRRLTGGRTLAVPEVSREILVEAARLRARHPALKLPDAIHAATALHMRCTTFLTNDTRFEVIPELPVLLVSQLP